MLPDRLARLESADGGHGRVLLRADHFISHAVQPRRSDELCSGAGMRRMRASDIVHARDDVRSTAGLAGVHIVSIGVFTDRRARRAGLWMRDGLLSAGAGVWDVRLFELRLRELRLRYRRLPDVWRCIGRICTARLFDVRRRSCRNGCADIDLYGFDQHRANHFDTLFAVRDASRPRHDRRAHHAGVGIRRRARAGTDCHDLSDCKSRSGIRGSDIAGCRKHDEPNIRHAPFAERAAGRCGSERRTNDGQFDPIRHADVGATGARSVIGRHRAVAPWPRAVRQRAGNAGQLAGTAENLRPAHAANDPGAAGDSRQSESEVADFERFATAARSEQPHGLHNADHAARLASLFDAVAGCEDHGSAHACRPRDG